MCTSEWVAVHRKHHAHCETERDPHSPQVLGLKTVFFKGALLYRRAADDKELLQRYAKGAPDDWLERRVYRGNSTWGPALMLLIDIVLFGPLMGIALALVQFIWIPLWAAGVINGLAHSWGYRNFGSKDASRNLLPWGLWIGGEELHNNHHAHPTSAKLSYHPWEVDIGWGAIRLLEAMKLATVRKAVRPPLVQDQPTLSVAQLFEQLASQRLQVQAWFEKAWAQSGKQSLRFENGRKGFTAWKQGLHLPEFRCPELPSMQELHTRWQELQQLWADRNATKAELEARLDAWLARAMASENPHLAVLARRMRCMA